LKKLVGGVVLLWCLFPANSVAQRGGGGHGGVATAALGGRRFVGSGFHGNGAFRSGNIGLPPVGPIPSLGFTRPFNRFKNFGFGWGGLGLGYAGDLGGYGDAGYYDSGYRVPMIVMPESYGPTSIQPPPPPVESVMHEYTWPESGDPSAVFLIVSKDDSVHSAVAVWIQDGAVRYITPDGTGGRLALGSVNRAATRSANAAKHLTLALPAENGRGR